MGFLTDHVIILSRELIDTIKNQIEEIALPGKKDNSFFMELQ